MNLFKTLSFSVRLTLKDLIDKGIVDKYDHLQKQRHLGGLTKPKKDNTDWYNKIDELSSK